MPLTPLSLEARQQRRRLQSRQYNDRNFEIRNEQTRARMAKLRASLSAEERAARLLARREADKQYRQRNREKIALNAKRSRQIAAEKKEELRQEQAAERIEALKAGRWRARARCACYLAVEAIQKRVDDVGDSSDSLSIYH